MAGSSGAKRNPTARGGETMVITDDFIWLHVPKCGGTDIRMQLKRQGGYSLEGFINWLGRRMRRAHMLVDEMTEYAEQDETLAAALASSSPTIAFCRHPVNRFRSICAFTHMTPDDVIRELRSPNAHRSFDSRLMLPQSMFAPPRTIWLRLEDLSGSNTRINGYDFDLRKASNTSASYSVPLEERHLEFIRDFYAGDHALGNYG